jgi:hypothetical protein
MNNTENKPFVVGDRVFNTGNKKRKTIGIVTRVIDAELCEVLWSDGEGYANFGTIRRDGSVNYSIYRDRAVPDRIVRVKLSVTIPQEV